MNRASLLHILDHAGGISEAEVRELEQLAAAFPYCQTAHLLLAKAAHDRGSMLAGQRLRRAATYAADRELLRALIEQPATVVAAPVAPAVPVPASVAEPSASAPEPAEVSAPEPAAEAGEPLGSSTLAAAENPAAALNGEVAEQPDPPQAAGAADEALPPQELLGAETLLPEPVLLPAAPAPQPQEAEDEPVAAEASLAPRAEDVAALQPEPEPSAEPQTAAVPEPTEPDEQPTAPADSPALVTADAAQAADAPVALALTGSIAGEAASPTLSSAGSAPMPLPAAVEEQPADELPPTAPLIRPPVEAGSSRFEFGLGDAPEPEPAYQLPELPAAPDTPAIPPYRGDEHLAYALAAGSRFGAALTLREAELTHNLPPAADWLPDAPLLAHLAAHRPAAPALPSSLALIEKFLRSQPRIKSNARPVPTDAPQADLSVRSTSAAPSLASESLAKIMVKQGKIGRAIEIYEQLMQRQPEKKAYFAAQIDLLTQQPE